MATAELKSKKGERLQAWFDFIFGFENKKGEILDHWIAFHDTLSLRPQEFYAAVEKELEERKIPGLTVSKEEFSEGALLADSRLYLRLFRERLAIYACAAPFGTGYFFSCRTVYVPALVRLWHIVATLLLFDGLCYLLIKPLGFAFTLTALVGLAFALAAVFRNAAGATVPDVDAFILNIPVVSTIYENWFRTESYFRVDTRAIYVQRIPQIIKKLAEEITAANGAKLQQQYRFAPILGELYKPSLPSQVPEIV